MEVLELKVMFRLIKRIFKQRVCDSSSKRSSINVYNEFGTVIIKLDLLKGLFTTEFVLF